MKYFLSLVLAVLFVPIYSASAAIDTSKLDQLRDNFEQASPDIETSQVLVQAKEFLLLRTDKLIEELNNLLLRTKSSSSLSDEQITEFKIQIQKDINWLESKKEMSQSMSIPELHTLIKEIQTYWKNNRIKLKHITGQLTASKIEKAIKKAEMIAKKIETHIQKLKKTGINTADLNIAFEAFSEKVNLARDQFNQAQEKFMTNKIEGDILVLFQEGNRLLVLSHKSLQGAQKNLKKVVKFLRKS